MEEIRQFKELHRGSTENILILLTSGTPETAIPEPLRTNGKGGKLEIRVQGQRPAVIRQRLLGLSRLVPAGALLGKIARQHQPVLIFRNPGGSCWKVTACRRAKSAFGCFGTIRS